MGNASVANYSAERLQGPKAHIPSLAAWRCQYSTQIPKTVDELPVREVTGGAESYSGQSRKRDSRSRRGKSLNTTATSQAGPLLENRPQSKSGSPGLDTKPETDEQRPLGIPTIHDRALQTLVKLALEPEWEARFEPNSYGFRPGRSCHDAIEAIFNATAHLEKYVLDADIAKCFDRINHDALLDKLNTGPKLRRQIKVWLKAGVLDNGELFPTERGTMQLGETARRHQHKEQTRLIRALNSLIIGWSRYYSTVVSQDIFEKVEYLLFARLFAWAKRRHPNKSKWWIVDQYWRITKGQGWRFQPSSSDYQLYQHRSTPIRRHVKVQGRRSPYDGDWLYWSTRLGKHPEVPLRVTRLLKRQRGRCVVCELFFKDGDVMEVVHIVSKHSDGLGVCHYRHLLHRHCYQAKSASRKLLA